MKGQWVTMRIASREEAERLHTILDEVIGVFRERQMTEAAQTYWDRKREEFISQFTAQIPSTYWFQGGGCKSITLHFDSTGFRVVSGEDRDRPHRLVGLANGQLSKARIALV